MDAARRNAVLVAWPALATVSLLWSLTPGLSLYHGLQLLTTVLVGSMLTIFARIEKLVSFDLRRTPCIRVAVNGLHIGEPS